MFASWVSGSNLSCVVRDLFCVSEGSALRYCPAPCVIFLRPSYLRCDDIKLLVDMRAVRGRNGFVTAVP